MDTSSYYNEIIVVDDASDVPFVTGLPLRVIRNETQRGVGFCFDRGVHEATGDIVVFMGSDVMVKEGWQDIVTAYVSKNPKGIGCSVCLSGDPEHTNPYEPANDVKRYGATVYPICTSEQLPSDSLLLERSQYYVGAFDAKWIHAVPKKKVSEVPCVYGAFYFTSKSWYQHINGWDSVLNAKLSGHSYWGSLEPWISIKNYLYGGKCHVVKDLETLHIFHKYQQGASPHGRTDRFWYNKMFFAHTMMEEDAGKRLLKKVYDLRAMYELYTLPFNLGKKLLLQNWKYVQEVKYRNKYEFVITFDDFCKHFDIEQNY
jgi:glycosyltransferase involved in cell wall biosynthesis